MSSRPKTPSGRGLQVQQLNVAVDGRQVLAGVSFTAKPGTLTAVIGPAGSGKSALINALGGLTPGSWGGVVLDGHDVNAPSMHSRIGVVPRQDVVHRQLTVEQAARYAAELRLPPGTSADERRRVVSHVLAELELSSRRTIQIGNLPDEKRKRASIAAELVTGPSMLVLDEPTAGLDLTEERHLMATLRRLAEAGRVVVVATTSPAYLELCDQVLLLTARGTVAFAGPPAQLEASMGSTDWSDIFHQLASDPDGAHQAFVAREEAPAAEQQAAPGQPPEPVARTGLWRQFTIALRRQAWLVAGNQRYLIFLTILPTFFAALALIVPGHTGFGKADPYGDSPDQAVELLVLLNMGAVVMGTALTIRDLVGERGVFARERFLGLSPSAYLGAKICVYSFVAIIQTAILTTAAVVGKGAPSTPALLLGNSTLELYVSVAATAIVSAILALALASLAKYQDQLLPIAVLVILLSLVFCGGTFPLAARYGVDVVSWFVPARWGFAASASSVNLEGIDVLATRDSLWMHSPDCWVLDMAMLTAMALAGIGFLRWRLRVPDRDRHTVNSAPQDERQGRPA